MLEKLSQSIKPRMLAFVLFACGSLLSTTLWTSVFKTTLVEYRDLQKRESQMNAVAVDPIIGEQRVAHIRQELAELRSELSVTGSNVLTGISPLSVMSDLSRFAEEEKLQLMGITPGNPIQSNHYREIPFSVVLNGPYSHVYRWIHAIENTEKPLYIKELSLSPGTNKMTRHMKVVVALIQPDEEA